MFVPPLMVNKDYIGRFLLLDPFRANSTTNERVTDTRRLILLAD